MCSWRPRAEADEDDFSCFLDRVSGVHWCSWVNYGNGDGGVTAIRAAQLVFFDDQIGLVGTGGKQRGRFGDRRGAGIPAYGFRGIGNVNGGKIGSRVKVDAPGPFPITCSRPPRRP
jgi:hypothetical protein